MGSLAIIGDVGGHAEQLRWALDRLGANEGQLSPDLTVIRGGTAPHHNGDGPSQFRINGFILAGASSVGR